MKTSWIVVTTICLVLLAAGAGLYVAAAQCRGEEVILRQVRAEHPCLGDVMKETLRVWEDCLGEPRTVEQTDGGTTFYYWPKAGLAAFAHPHYEGQYQARGEEERRITSVIVPLREEVHPQVPPVAPEVTIRFTRLLTVELPEASAAGTPEAKGAAQPKNGPARDPARRRELFRCRWRLLAQAQTYLYLDARGPSEIEIRESWVLSHYD